MPTTWGAIKNKLKRKPLENNFQRLCRIITNHKLRKGTMWSVGIEPREFHYKCLICGKTFWNYTPHRKYLKTLKEKAGVDNETV